MVQSLRGRTAVQQVTSIASQGIISLIGIGRTMVLLRMLGPDDYGVLGITLAIGGTVAMVQGLGLGTGAAKEAARASTAEAQGFVALILVAVRGVMVLPLALFLGFASAVAAAFYGYEILQPLLWLYALGLVASAPLDVLSSVLTGSQRFRTFFRLRLANEIVLTILVIAMVSRWKLPGYFVGQAIGAALYAVLLSVAVWGPSQPRIRWPGRDSAIAIARSSLRTGLSIFAGKLSRSLSLQMPILVAGRFVAADHVGWLKFGMQAGGYVGTLLSAAQIITLPRMVRHLRLGGPDALLHNFSRNLLHLSSGVALIIVFIVAVAPDLVRVVGGVEYEPAIRPFQATVQLYGVIFLADSIYTGIHLPLDRERDYVVSYVIYGVTGASLAIAAVAVGRPIDWPVYGLVLAAWIHFIMALASSGARRTIQGLFMVSFGRVAFASGIAVWLTTQTSATARMTIAVPAMTVLLLESIAKHRMGSGR